MQDPIINELPKSRVELKFTVTPEEAKPYLDQAAQDLQSAKAIKGFRPGKAPYSAVKAEFGEMKIWETALERIVRARYVHTILEKNIETVGSPEISVDTLTPGQDIVFTVCANVMPKVEKIADYSKTLVTKEITPTTKEETDAAVEELQKMRRKEVVVDVPATKDHMVEIDMEMKKDGVAIEDGSAKKYRVYLNEAHYIPGFAEQLIGLKRGDDKTFDLELPKEHYNKDLAGKKLTFDVHVHDVYELALPKLDDTFASELGFDTLEKLRQTLTDNLSKEKRQKSEEAAEVELLETLAKNSRFTDVPDLLVNEEVRRMFDELTHAAEAQGMKAEDYFAQLKKTSDEIKLDMVPRALDRIKVAVLIRAIADQEKIEVTDEELDAEVDRVLSGLKGNTELRDRVTSPEYRDYMRSQMKNRKTIERLKEKAVSIQEKA